MGTNLNDLAKAITLREGKKENLSIGQVKEVMKLLFKELAYMPFEEVVKLLLKYRG